MTFDQWFAIQPHPVMSDEEIATMREDYLRVWKEAQANVLRPEGERCTNCGRTLPHTLAECLRTSDAAGQAHHKEGE